MKPAPSTFGLAAIAILAVMLFSFAGGMEFANSRHEEAAQAAMDAGKAAAAEEAKLEAEQAKWIAEQDEAEHAYRSRIRELEAACGQKAVKRDSLAESGSER